MQKMRVATALGLLGLLLLARLFLLRKPEAPQSPQAPDRTNASALRSRPGPDLTPGVARPTPLATPDEAPETRGRRIRIKRPGRPDQIVGESEDLAREREDRVAHVRTSFDQARRELQSEFLAILGKEGLAAGAKFLESSLKPATELKDQARVLESLELYTNILRKVVSKDRDARPLASEEGAFRSQLRSFIADPRNQPGVRSVAIGLLAGFDPDIEVKDSPMVEVDGVPTYDFTTPILPRWGVKAQVRSAPDPGNLVSADPAAAKILLDLIADDSQNESIRRVALLSLADNPGALQAVGLDRLSRTSPALVSEIASLWAVHPEALSVDQAFGLLSLPIDDRMKATVLSRLGTIAPQDERLTPLFTQVLSMPVADDLGSRTLFRSALDQAVKRYSSTHDAGTLTCLAQALPRALEVDWRGASPVGPLATFAADHEWVEWGAILRPLLPQIKDPPERAAVEQALERLKR